MRARYPPSQQYDQAQQNQAQQRPQTTPNGLQGNQQNFQQQQQTQAAGGVSNPFAFAQARSGEQQQQQQHMGGSQEFQSAAAGGYPQQTSQMHPGGQRSQANLHQQQRPGYDVQGLTNQMQNTNLSGSQSQRDIRPNPTQQRPGQVQDWTQNQQQQVPEFEAESLDEFNSDKSLMRMTTDRIPHTSSLAKDCSIPLAILVKPFGEMPSGDPIPTVSFNNKPIVRCRDCRAYINPFVKWTDNGQKWHCNFCKIDNTTENYYYCATGTDGIRKDINERPELYSGSVDFLASNEYMNRPPMPPTFVFLFDVSQPAVDSGYLFQAASTIKGIIEEGSLPGGDRTRVCFLAYDKNLYFFNLRCTLKQPQMIVVPNADQAFLPQPDDLLVNLTESYDIIVNMLDNFHAFFHQSGSPSTQDTNFVPALNCATTVAKHIGGKILMFQVSHAVSKSKYLALNQPAGKTDGPNEKFGTTNQWFAETASELAHFQLSVDLFVFTHGKGQYKNMATFSDLAKKSNGNLFFYPEFSQYQHGMKFTNELYTSLTRANAWEAVFRIRTSTGFIQNGTYGNFLIKQKTNDLVLCPQIDKDRVIVYEIERMSESAQTQERKRIMMDQRHLYLQSALLYSTSDGERRIRVHNAAIAMTNIKHLPFEYLDTSALALFWARSSMTRLSLNRFNFGSVQTQLEMALQQLCRAQARLSQGTESQPQPGELPEALQYLALYVFGLLKTPLVSPVVQTPQNSPYMDSLATLKFQVFCMSPEEVVPMFYPQIYAIDDGNLTDTEFPGLEMLQRHTLRSDGLYLCYDAQNVYIFVGRQCDPNFLLQLFKTNDVNQIDLGVTEEEVFRDVENSVYLMALYSIINQVRYQRQPFCALRILVEGDKESERLIGQMCVLDMQRECPYNKDYSKFMADVSPPQTHQHGGVSTGLRQQPQHQQQPQQQNQNQQQQQHMQQPLQNMHQQPMQHTQPYY